MVYFGVWFCIVLCVVCVMYSLCVLYGVYDVVCCMYVVPVVYGQCECGFDWCMVYLWCMCCVCLVCVHYVYA